MSAAGRRKTVSAAEWSMRNAHSIAAGKTREQKIERFVIWARTGLDARAEIEFAEGEGENREQDRRYVDQGMEVACGSDPDEARVRMAEMLFDADVIESDEGDVQWDV